MKKGVWTALALVALGAFATSAGAEQVVYNFSGKITDVTPGGLFPSSIKPGDTFTGSFRFDGSLPAGAPGYYPLVAGGMEILVGGTHHFAIDPASGFIAVGDNVLTGTKPRDQFFAQMNATAFPPITAHGPVTYSGIVSLVAEKDLGALTANNLGVKLDLSKFDSMVVEFAGGDTAASGFWMMRGEFTSLQRHEAPEPGSLALLALGGAGLVGYRLRRRRG